MYLFNYNENRNNKRKEIIHTQLNYRAIYNFLHIMWTYEAEVK